MSVGSLPLRLRWLNLARWLREYAVSWGLLGLIYSFTVTLVLQPFLELALKREIPVPPLWALTCAVLLFPAAIEALAIPGVGSWIDRVLRAGTVSRLLRAGGGELGVLYIRHELRRAPTWVGILLAGGLANLLPSDRLAFWVVLSQLPLQRALYSIHHWRRLALLHYPRSGAVELLRAFIASQLLQSVLAWLVFGMLGAAGQPRWLALGAAGVSASIAAASVALEGDSGRPWLVNFISLTAAILAGFATLWSLWALPITAYLAFRMLGTAAGRLHSVEFHDEDLILS